MIFNEKMILYKDPIYAKLAKKARVLRNKIALRDPEHQNIILRQKDVQNGIEPICFSNDFLCELFNLQKLKKMAYRYSPMYLDIASI